MKKDEIEAALKAVPTPTLSQFRGFVDADDRIQVAKIVRWLNLDDEKNFWVATVVPVGEGKVTGHLFPCFDAKINGSGALVLTGVFSEEYFDLTFVKGTKTPPAADAERVQRLLEDFEESAGKARPIVFPEDILGPASDAPPFDPKFVV